MSTFTRKATILLGSACILYIFTCSTFNPFFSSNQTINHDELVAYTLEEVTYELTYGNKNLDIDVFVDNAIKEALLKK